MHTVKWSKWIIACTVFVLIVLILIAWKRGSVMNHTGHWVRPNTESLRCRYTHALDMLLLRNFLTLLSRIWLQNLQYIDGIGGTVSRNSTGCARRSEGGRHWGWWSGNHVRLRDRWDDRMYAVDDCSGAQT